MVKSNTEPASVSPALALDRDIEVSENTSDVIFCKSLKGHRVSAAREQHIERWYRSSPQHKIPRAKALCSKHFHQTDESEENDLSSDLVVRSRTEPATRVTCDAAHAWRKQKEKTLRFADVADSIEDDTSDELAMTYVSTFDPFEHSDMEECNSDRTVVDSDSDDLPVTSMKTFDYFENAASTLPVLQPVVATVQPVLFGLGMAGVMLTPAHTCHTVLTSSYVQSNAPDRSSQSIAQPACGELDISIGQYQQHLHSVSEQAADDISNISAMPEQCCIQEELPRLLGTSLVSDALRKDVSLSSPLQVDCLSGGRTLVRWALDVRKLSSSEKQLLSPEFKIDFPGLGPQPFRMMVLAKQMRRHKGGQTFAKAQGRARLLIKSAASMPDHASRVAFSMTIGDTSRGPFWHQFVEQTCCDLQAVHEDWDLLAAKSLKHVEICLQVAEFEV